MILLPAKADWKVWAATFLRLLCGAILIYASQDKLGNPLKFSGAVENYRMLPQSLIPLAAVVIPWLEFFTGVCLVVGWRWRAAALIFCGLMAVYSLALSVNLLRGIEMNCGCFGDSSEKVTGWTVSRDILFFSMGFIVLTARQTLASLDALLEP